jgi:hypothetical protein
LTAYLRQREIKHAVEMNPNRQHIFHPGRPTGADKAEEFCHATNLNNPFIFWSSGAVALPDSIENWLVLGYEIIVRTVYSTLISPSFGE